MRKTITGPGGVASKEPDGAWLSLDERASVEVTSEDPAHPIEAALVAGAAEGWRAGSPGEQIIRLRFDAPQHVRRIAFSIDERTRARTQELALSWTDDAGQGHEIVRQRWNFSPQGSTHQAEDHRVDLRGVAVLTLTIQPDVSDPAAVASLTRLRVG